MLHILASTSLSNSPATITTCIQRNLSLQEQITIQNACAVWRLNSAGRLTRDFPKVGIVNAYSSISSIYKRAGSNVLLALRAD